ncbi:SHOCT domain-containing protein [Gracilibacillus dipsosauri]|uniref:SHOCT domain-containing protein n=1 Tax=Gracilibacillus dipsosauri TaxID=178340 RepID=A0A317KSI3_9BACI|nr:SHOCT domain-containing protein [Gracilibacillus dipsosauri]PWU66542.1 SHOCT domain-containing protein [Gracilibacillus dipsosauri]
MAKHSCVICEKSLGLSKFKIADNNYLCNNCFRDTNLTLDDFKSKPLRNMTALEIKDILEENKKNEKLLQEFSPTKKISNFIFFDDNKGKWIIPSGFGKIKNQKVYDFDDILKFELLEDGETVTKGGLGMALVGGALFGGTGAIVGGVTSKKSNKGICTNLRLKITTKNINKPVVYIDFIKSKTKKKSLIYKSVYNAAQECLSVLQVICDRNKEDARDDTSEILKYKKLLDEGILTQEEFDKKKKELLNL